VVKELVMVEANELETGAVTSAFKSRLLTSDAFMSLFREGMALVEATAAYLDGEGRSEARKLDRFASLAYASESMRLTTRLMQMTSWLLLRRAVNEGELSIADAEDEARKVKLRPQDAMITDSNQALIPQKLRDLVDQSIRLQNRIMKLDSMQKDEPVEPTSRNAVADQINSLQVALAGRFGGR
jgi:regulator of CtrA degradation